MKITNNVLMGAFGNDVKRGKLVIPDGITTIDSYAVAYSESKNIFIPDSVTHINRGAFAYCDNLKNIIIPKGVTRIEGYTFFYCSNLKSIIIPKSVRYIGESAFDVSALKSKVGAYKAFHLTPSGKLKCMNKIYKENQ